MTINLTIDESRLTARLDKITPDVRAALVQALGPIAQSIAAEARGIAAAHIQFEGVKPGAYLASIYGNVSDKSGKVIGFVRSGNPLAHLLEYGTKERFRKTFKSAKEVLGELRTGYTGVGPELPAIGPAFESARGEIETAISQALEGSLNR